MAVALGVRWRNYASVRWSDCARNVHRTTLGCAGGTTFAMCWWDCACEAIIRICLGTIPLQCGNDEGTK